LPPTNQAGQDAADLVVDSLPRRHRSLQYPNHRQHLEGEQPEEHDPQREVEDPNSKSPGVQAAQEQQRREASAPARGVLPPDSTGDEVEAAAAAQVLRIGKIIITQQITSGVCRLTTSLMGTWLTVGAAASWTRPSKSG
jgi:hypothetical protein